MLSMIKGWIVNSITNSSNQDDEKKEDKPRKETRRRSELGRKKTLYETQIFRFPGNDNFLDSPKSQ